MIDDVHICKDESYEERDLIMYNSTLICLIDLIIYNCDTLMRVKSFLHCEVEWHIFCGSIGWGFIKNLVNDSLSFVQLAI